MENKIAKTKYEWNSASYDLYIDEDDIPKNIDFKDILDLHKQIEKYKSISKIVNINIGNSKADELNNGRFIIVGKSYIKIDNDSYKRL